MNSLSNCATKSRYERIINKTINCIDCGKEVVVDARNMTKVRCDECYKIYRRKKKTETMRKLRKGNKNS